MFHLADGRQHVYQWDINVKLLLDESNKTADEVHFSARFSRVSLSVVAVHTEASSYVTISNILLQKPSDIIAYSYITNADGSYTKYDTIIPVIARPKPSGYIYEETEILTWKTLDDKIDDLGKRTADAVKYIPQKLTDEQKSRARTNIGAVSVNEIPIATNNAAGVVKPVSKTDEMTQPVGVDGITIPEKLPNPNALTFSGAVTGSYDGSAPLEVEIPSGSWGGNPLYVNGGTTLAEGTIPSGLAQYTFTDTGLKFCEVLQEWKIFFIQVYCAGEVNNISICTYQNNTQPFYNPDKNCNYALSVFEGVTKDSVKFMFFGTGVGKYWDVYSPAGTISSHNVNPVPTLSIKHIPPDTGLYLRNYGKDTKHDYLWKVTGLVKWG